MTGFINNGRLSREQQRFKFILSSKIMKIEHTFGLQKAGLGNLMP